MSHIPSVIPTRLHVIFDIQELVTSLPRSFHIDLMGIDGVDRTFNQAVELIIEYYLSQYLHIEKYRGGDIRKMIDPRLENEIDKCSPLIRDIHTYLVRYQLLGLVKLEVKGHRASISLTSYD